MSDLSKTSGGPEALAEATVDSLADLFSKDPEKFTEQDMTRLVENLRAQRARWQVQEAETAAKPKGAKSVANKAKSLITDQSAGDLGL